MFDRSQLPYLVDLIDDETEEVRSEVLKEFSNYGTELEADLIEFAVNLNSSKFDLIKPILEDNRRIWLKENWDHWFNIENEKEKLETAMNLLANFQYGVSNNDRLTHLLNVLAEEFKNFYPFGVEIDLANFLFQSKNLRGAKKDYYNPLNSNLIYTIEKKKGLPITLAIVYMLIGERLGFNIEGCNFPGLFLAKIEMEDEIILVDCYNGGKLVYEADLANIVKDSVESIFKLVRMKTRTSTIIRRTLNNITNAYEHSRDINNKDFFTELLKATPL